MSLPRIIAPALAAVVLAGCSAPPQPAATVTVTAAAPAPTTQAPAGEPSPTKASEAPSPAVLTSGQSITFGAGITVTATWKDYDPTDKASLSDRVGCQWIHWTVRNGAGADLVTATSLAGASSASPFVSADYLDNGESAEFNPGRGRGNPFWPSVLYAGKSGSWDACVYAGRGDRIRATLSLQPGSGMPATTLGVWDR